MIKEVLADKGVEELKVFLKGLGVESFRAKQIFNNIHNGKTLNEMTDISIAHKQILNENFITEPVSVIEKKVSVDGTEKYLFKLYDGNVIECVLMKYSYGNTICVSTQVGCRMNCAFCASGLDGLVRNMTAGEILSEVLVVNKLLGGNIKNRNITNIVLMGSGEPLDNYENVVKFLKLVSCSEGINVSTRNISLSTCGIVPNIYKLAEEGFSLNLTISLHNPFDEERAKIMPIAKKYKISEIIDACKYYFEKTKRRYIFEYCLIDAENDSVKHANELIKVLKGLPCHVNIIRLNPVKEKVLKPTSENSTCLFLSQLESKGISVTLRRQIGKDIDGACGQLRQNYLADKS